MQRTVIEYLYVITHKRILCDRLPFLFPLCWRGFVAVLVGYASSAAIIWQAAASAGATPGQIAGWMTALGLAMGISTLALSGWRKVPVLTAWSTPGAALLVSGLQGVTLAEAVGVFIFANALIVLCGVTGLFARLMKIIPHSLAAAMLAGILLRFGLQAFAGLQEHLLLCGGMLAAWLLCKALWPRFAVVAALVVGALIAAASGDVARTAVPLAFAAPKGSRRSLPRRCCSVSACRFSSSPWPRRTPPGSPRCRHPATPYRYRHCSSPVEVWRCCWRRLGVYSICIAAITAAICQSPEAHPDPQQRWLRPWPQAVFICWRVCSAGRSPP
ncbi:benzoate/H(+) symporter BenE family transporter [Klebsiella variicola subsp. variicola]|nr:benzoate/H(+) symporter BenE family transporter [Klebsiella variicola subsp. variicola]